ncbi:YybH family protein [Pseudorhodoferax sp.]|uniref:YybH family protein n=1 Tax=Pseudorhodoferax sp. TaxID=1993553 RepID=UPI002DD651DF|nr:nuclear transport factor 2 family protein [Pseudorhodoferax sp.]
MRRPNPPQALVLAEADDAEAQFYEALQQGDLARLMAVWADDDDIVCVHPGGERVVGAAAIRASFEALFSGGGVPVMPGQWRRINGQGVAVHTLVERLHRHGQPADPAHNVLATNVYLHTPLGWRLVAHHASPGGSETPAAAPEWPSTLH